MVAGDDAAIARYDGVVTTFYEADGKWFDSSWSQTELELWGRTASDACGNARYRGVCEAMVETRGRTHGGVVYDLGSRMASGRSCTTVWNSTRFMVALEWALGREPCAGSDRVVDMLRVAGVPVKWQAVGVDSLTFCQMAMWPVEPYEVPFAGGSVVVDRHPGLLPGRVLQRLTVCKAHAPPTTPRGRASYLYSVSMSCMPFGFAPIVREYLMAMRAFAKRIDPHVRIRESFRKVMPFVAEAAIDLDVARARDTIMLRYSVGEEQLEACAQEVSEDRVWVDGQCTTLRYAGPFVRRDN
jgi:hypothetical protein